MQASPIEWCTATWNPTRGCRRIGKGCAHCYAEKTAARFNGPGKAYEGLTTDGRWNGNVKVLPDKFDEPLVWKDPETIFVDSMSDLFFDAFDAETVIAPIFATMIRAWWHTFIVLTKRYERAALLTNDPAFVTAVREHYEHIAIKDPHGKAAPAFAWPPPNVLLGGSISDQDEADRSVPIVLRFNAAVRVLSVEPLIGSMDLTRVQHIERVRDEEVCGEVLVDINALKGTWELGDGADRGTSNRIDWVIVGGESGPGARPCRVELVRSIKDQCLAAGVPVFVKQLGARVIATRDEWHASPVRNRDAELPGGKQVDEDAACNKAGMVVLPLRDRKGGDWSEWPEDLRVRQFPKSVRHADTEATAIEGAGSEPTSDPESTSPQHDVSSSSEAAANVGAAADREVR